MALDPNGKIVCNSTGQVEMKDIIEAVNGLVDRLDQLELDLGDLIGKGIPWQTAQSNVGGIDTLHITDDGTIPPGTNLKP